jgi:hypothetical protein
VSLIATHLYQGSTDHSCKIWTALARCGTWAQQTGWTCLSATEANHIPCLSACSTAHSMAMNKQLSIEEGCNLVASLSR